MKYLVGIMVFAAATTACKGEEVAANVNCKVTAEETVECSVEQTKGSAEIDVCWDFGVKCASGATLKAARTCAKVKDGQTANVTVPSEKLTIEGACEGAMEATLTNMTYNGKKSEI